MPMVQNVVHCLAIEQASMHQFFLVFIKAQKLFRKKEANMRRKTLLKNSESKESKESKRKILPNKTMWKTQNPTSLEK